MKRITIDFFPATRSAKLWFETLQIDPAKNVVANCLKEKPIDEWLNRYRQGYYMWRGLLPELMDETDDDELVIVIRGPLAVYQQIQQAFKAQTAETDAMGFRHDAFQLIHEQSREIEDCKQYLARIYKECSKFIETPNQEMLFIRRAYEETIGTADSFEQIYRASSQLVKLLTQQSNENFKDMFSEWIDQIKAEIWGDNCGRQ